MIIVQRQSDVSIGERPSSKQKIFPFLTEYTLVDYAIVYIEVECIIITLFI